jgi:hypothetical protein
MTQKKVSVFLLPDKQTDSLAFSQEHLKTVPAFDATFPGPKMRVHPMERDWLA